LPSQLWSPFWWQLGVSCCTCDPGAGIGWHRDRPVFERVLGVSLGESGSHTTRRWREMDSNLRSRFKGRHDRDYREVLGLQSREALRRRAWEWSLSKETSASEFYATIFDRDEEWLISGTSFKENEKVDFTFSENGLTLYFPPYQVACFAAGSWEVTHFHITISGRFCVPTGCISYSSQPPRDSSQEPARLRTDDCATASTQVVWWWA
jgi:hypothetical protein